MVKTTPQTIQLFLRMGLTRKSNTPLQRNVDALKIYQDSFQVDNCYEWEDDRNSVVQRVEVELRREQRNLL